MTRTLRYYEKQAAAAAERLRFGRFVQHARVANRLTQGALARRAGLTTERLRRLERGIVRLRPTEIEALTAALAALAAEGLSARTRVLGVPAGKYAPEPTA